MASLCVELLFNNILIDETIKNSVNDFFANNMYQGKLSKSELYYLLKLATSVSFFINFNIVCKQNDNLNMGLPFEPTLTYAFSCHYKTLWLDNYPPEYKSVAYRIYVDDILVVFKSKHYLLSLLRYMITRHKNSKFTFGFEQNISFSFLDIKITRESKGFSVFLKVTLSRVFTNFDSFYWVL